MWQDAAWRQLLPLVRVELRYLGFAEMQKVGNVGQSIAEKKGSFSSISLVVQNLSISKLLLNLFSPACGGLLDISLPIPYN